MLSGIEWIVNSKGAVHPGTEFTQISVIFSALSGTVLKL